MEKLKVYDIYGYLPHGLKLRTITKPSFNNQPDIVDIFEWNMNDISKPFGKRYGVLECKPILRPISELMEETIEGEVPLIQVIVDNTDSVCDAYQEWVDSYIDNPDMSRIKQAPFEVVDELYKRFYDVNNLIERKLALSTHELYIDPYV